MRIDTEDLMLLLNVLKEGKSTMPSFVLTDKIQIGIAQSTVVSNELLTALLEEILFKRGEL
jgi:hypothetical protein